MMKFVLLALVVVSGASAHGSRYSEKEYSSIFADWKETHNKVYVSDLELLARFSTFKKNVDMIESHNAGNHSWTMAMNQFGDLTAEEFKVMHTGVRYVNRPYLRAKNYANKEDLFATKAPDSIDWREKGAVSEVKDQGDCGSCWAFSTTGSVEGANFLSTGTMTELSEQDLMDCSSSYGNMGCNGGLMDNAFEYIVAKGICSEDDYPYQEQDGKCNTKCKTAATISSYTDVPSGDEDSLLQAVATVGPVSIAIEADQKGFQFYSSGVFDGKCGTELDHGVLAVGYGTDSDSGKDYWIVKNSWSATWGDKGYILLVRGQDQCGLALAASYPVV